MNFNLVFEIISYICASHVSELMILFRRLTLTRVVSASSFYYECNWIEV